MIGQKDLIQQLTTYTIDSFPHTCLLLGESGCGKHTLVSEIIKPKILNDIPLLDITKEIDSEVIKEIYRNPNPAIYLVDMSKITEKEQNDLLKLTEEPAANAFIILLAENRNVLLNTILNRCIVFEFSQYSETELESFLSADDDKDLILSLVKTPGKIKLSNLKTLPALKELCIKIVTRIQDSNYSNALSIANKLNYDNEYDKFDIDLFLNLMEKLLLEHYTKKIDKKERDRLFKMYLSTLDTKKKLSTTKAKAVYVMPNYISQLWKASRE